MHSRALRSIEAFKVVEACNALQVAGDRGKWGAVWANSSYWDHAVYKVCVRESEKVSVRVC